MSLQDLVIVTGMSGSGKGTVLKAFEDMGFFCIDNLPVQLIPKFIEGIHVSGGEIERVALVIDVRAGEHLRGLQTTIARLHENDFRTFVLFLEARDDALVRRFSETRRPHPLTAETPIRDAIHQERKRLRSLRDISDFILDTSDYSVHQVKAVVTNRFRAQPRSSTLSLNLLSFGFGFVTARIEFQQCELQIKRGAKRSGGDAGRDKISNDARPQSRDHAAQPKPFHGADDLLQLHELVEIDHFASGNLEHYAVGAMPRLHFRQQVQRIIAGQAVGAEADIDARLP